MFLTYRELYPEDYRRGPSRREQIEREWTDYQRREAARLARNAAREERQARWPERRRNGVLAVSWSVLADALVKGTNTTQREN